VPNFVCSTCGTQFPESAEPPSECPICEDPRQYVPPEGQRWTTLDELRRDHRNEVREDAGFTGIGTEPSFAIGQRLLLVPAGTANVMWDCITLVDDDSVRAVEDRGGIRAIAISHCHYYSSMVEWSHALGGVPIYVHEDDREWVLRPDPVVEYWRGEVLDLGDGLTLIRCGGHFAGGTVLHWRDGAGGAGALLSGDIVQVIPDRTHVGFMYSYPNLIPLPEASVTRIAEALGPYDFDVIYGAWWDRLVRRDAKAIVRRSAQRYSRALRGEMTL
jgi:glyoxylase-like metal-dependent hydrolase (beta-lactamase superfamily II)